MRIVRARTQLVRWPIAPDGAARDRRERTALLLEIVTADGHVGLGEAAPLPGMSTDTLEDAEAALTSFVSRVPFELAPVLEELAISASGRIVSLSPEAAPPLVDDAAPVATSTERTPTTPMEVARAGDTARHRVRRESTRHAGGGATRGVLDDVIAHSASTTSPSARFAIETALLAAAAREMGMPVATLLVPRPAVSLPCATVVDDPAAARRAVLAGVRTLKIKVGPTGDIDRVIAIHRAAPDAMLRIDANRSWPRDRVGSILRALAELPIEFVEEPSANTLALLSEAVPVPLALDESLALLSPEQVTRALASRSLGAIVVKPTLVGGLHAATQLAAKAREAGKRIVISHALEGPIGTAACAALAVAIGERDTAVGLAPALASWPIGLPHLTPAMLHAALEPGLGLDRLTRLASRLDAPTRLVDLAGHLDRALERAALPNDIALITPSRSVRFDEPLPAPVTSTIIGQPSLDSVLQIRAAVAGRAPLSLHHHRLLTEEQTRQRTLVEQSALAAGSVVLFTSGSTGTPRGVVHTRESIAAAVAASEQHLGWRPGDRWLLALPTAHAGGLAVLARCDAARVPVVLLEGDFDRARCAALLEDCTLVSLVPTQLAALLDDPNWRPPAKLRAVLLGGAAAPMPLLDAAASRGVPFLTSYGLTETFGQIATAPLGHAGDPRAPLVPLPGVLIRGGTRAQPAPLVVETRQLAARYLDGAPIAPRFTTSDLGFVEDGRVHVVGRADDVIITGGENVHPVEVETALLATSGVRAAVAFGVADARWGQLVAAVIVVDTTFDETRALAQWDKLPAHAQPRELAIADALPLLPNGKIDRRAAAAIPRRALRSRA
jgi:L-alanine-DL-glutamate epimerase-like enolase superfamily enzyme/acyl-coenzyme A synthetase/AMP-(fatty) acid ligase